MAKTSGRLTVLAAQHAKKPGMLADGDGLYLQVAGSSSRSWIFRCSLHGKSREMGLGSLKAVVRRTPGLRSRSYAWSIDKNSALIAKAKGEKRIGPQAARAMANQFLQPQINEMFFAQFVIFVEGDEDRSLLSKYLQLTKRYAEILSKGAHIVPINGKGNMINALSMARGFEIPIYAVVDGDMTLRDAEEVKQNARLNKDVLALLQYKGPEKDGLLKRDLWGKNFCIWNDCLQNSFGKRQADWDKERQNICQEFGWSVSRLKKNPMVMEATLEKFYKGKPIEHLERLCVSIFKSMEPIKVVG